jgi:thiaminase
MLCPTPPLFSIVNTPTDMRYSLVGALVALVTSSLGAAQVAETLGVDNPFKSKANPYSTFIDHCTSLNTPSLADIQSRPTLQTRRSTFNQR